MRAARRAIADGHRWVVDVDLDRFFGRVNHDMVMARVACRVNDRKVLRLVRRFLEAGVMVDGLKHAVAEGTRQGSPLSPLLSNIMLDDLDRELFERGHWFVRYADDLRVFVRSERAAQRVLDSIMKVVEKRLRLKVNRDKSSVRHASKATLLGFGFYFSREGVGVRLAPKSIDRLKERIRELTSRRWSVAMGYRLDRLNGFITGWMGYFRLADAKALLRDLDEWLRRGLRQIRWKEWKRPATRQVVLRRLGIPGFKAREWSSSSQGCWRIANSWILSRSLPNAYWDGLGLRSLSQVYRRFWQVV